MSARMQRVINGADLTPVELLDCSEFLRTVRRIMIARATKFDRCLQTAVEKDSVHGMYQHTLKHLLLAADAMEGLAHEAERADFSLDALRTSPPRAEGGGA